MNDDGKKIEVALLPVRRLAPTSISEITIARPDVMLMVGPSMHSRMAADSQSKLRALR